jgi:hypothetical protein
MFFQKLIVTQPLKKSCFLYGTRRSITVFTKACHWILSWASRIQFAPSIPISPKSCLMLLSHLRLDLPGGLLPSGPQPKPCKHLFPPQECHVSRPSHPPWFNHPNNIMWRIQVMNFIIMQLSPRSVFLPFRSKYLPQNIMFSETLSPCSSLKVRDQVSHPYSTTGKNEYTKI